MKLAGWIILALFALFMLGASVAPKLLRLEAARAPLEQIGYPVKYLLLIGLMELAFTLLVLYPRTAMLGGILMTGLLGGAIASQLRAEMPLASHTLFGVYLGLFMWLGIALRSPALLAIFAGRGQ
ncbi:DoxX family protein [Vannielia sp. SX4]|uniref:DoxX family protein n=1 Tax=Vannielia sp. SX4 TaxID=3463852 RepID=UPI00405839C0